MLAVTALDLDRYLARIGYDGDRLPRLDVLARIVGLHTQAIPFENLDPLLGRPVPLDLQSLQAKLVDGRRGGYCFEQNALLRAAFDALGFRTTGLGGRVVWQANDDEIPPRTHMVVLVDLDGDRYLADVGFGGQTPTAPLRLELGTPQATPHGRLRLLELDDGDVVQQVELEGEWRSMYRFDLVPQRDADYEVANYFVSTHPDSHFRQWLTVARATGDGRWALRNRQLSFYGLDGVIKQRTLQSADELRDVLTTEFLLDVPPGRELDDVFARLPVD